MRSLSLVLCLLFAVSGLAARLAAETVPPLKVLATVEGEFRSMTALADGGLLLLGKESLVRIGPDGKPVVIPLPAIPGPRPEAGITDVTALGTTLYACRFSDPTLYTLDLDEPTAWKPLPVTGLPAGRIEFAEIGRLGERVGLVDANGGRFSVDAQGAATALAAGALPLAAPDAQPVFLRTPDRKAPSPGQAPADAPSGVWQVTAADGKVWFARHDPGQGVYLEKLRPLGFTADGRLIVLEVTAAGELREKRTLHAVENGKIIATREIPSSDPGPLIRAHLLLSDGRVALLSRNEGGKTEVLVHQW